MRYFKGKIYFNEPLKNHTTFRIGGPCAAWCEPADEADLAGLLRLAASRRKKIFVMGMGSNILADDGGLRGYVAHLGQGYFKSVRFSGGRIIAGAGVGLNYLINLSCGRGYEGLEGLAGIPGTLGGAIFMNAGYKGNISDCLESVRVMDKKSLKARDIRKENIKFGYRHSDLDRYIILEGTFRLRKNKRETILRRKQKYLKAKRKEQPMGLPSAGCFFKNPEGGIPAGFLIDMLNLKGKRVGGAEVSEKHANFIINRKNANSRDVMRLAGFIKKRVKRAFGVDLVPEVTII